MKFLFSLFLLAGLASCCGNKGTISANTETSNTDMIEAGFIAAIVVHQKDQESPCDYILRLEDQSLLEPDILTEEFKSDLTEVWIKYIPSRRRTLCGNSQPITISEIKMR